MLRVVREAFGAFGRAPLLVGLSAAMVALSLSIVGLFGLSAHNVRLVLDRIEAQVEVVVYLRDDASGENIDLARAELGSLPEVLEVRYISRERALEIAERELEEFRAIFAELDVNPLPASLEIALRPGHRDPESVAAIAARAGAFDFVEDVRYGQEWLNRIFLLRRIAGASAGVLGAAFVVGAIFIIGAAVRMAIFARREEISIMRLVGATDGYIRRPYVLEGMLTGLGGGAVALGLVYAVHRVLAGSVVELQWLPLEWIIAGVAAGALLGATASSFAVRRHMRDV